MTMGLAMLVMGIIYKKTKKLQIAWIGLGVVYSIGIFGVLTNSALLDMFSISKGTSFISPIALIILGVGIMLSYIIFGKDEQKTILSVLIVVGIHFLPFISYVTYLLAPIVIGNALLGFYLKKVEVSTFVFTNALIKFLAGIMLFFLN